MSPDAKRVQNASKRCELPILQAGEYGDGVDTISGLAAEPDFIEEGMKTMTEGTRGLWLRVLEERPY